MATNRAMHLDDCLPLLEACTPRVYADNPFRITGLVTDAGTRDIKRRIDELKDAEELGDAEDEHTHAFAIKPPPSLDAIREAAKRLQDPEVRLIHEFFWFWPMEWGNGKRDEALRALAKNNPEEGDAVWKRALKSTNSREVAVAKHNLAVRYQMAALRGEEKALTRNLSPESLERVETYWRQSFKWWEDLTDDESFWSLVTERIRGIEDARLTTGFARRMRATFPEAMDKINGELALQYIEAGKLDFARQQINYMNETHQGLDDVPKTLALVTEPLRRRVHNALDQARDKLGDAPENAAKHANELFESVEDTIDKLREMLTDDDHHLIDLRNEIAETALDCAATLAEDKRNIPTCEHIFARAKNIAEDPALLEQIELSLTYAKYVPKLELIIDACEKSAVLAEREPQRALELVMGLVRDMKFTRAPLKAPAPIRQLLESDAPANMKDAARNHVAGALGTCAIALANATSDYEDSGNTLRLALDYASDPNLRQHLLENLEILERNKKLKRTVEARHRAEQSGNWGCLVLAGIGIVVWIIASMANGSGDSSGSRSYSSPTNSPSRVTSPTSNDKRPSTNSSSRAALGRRIESDKSRADQMERELEGLKRQLDGLESQLNSYERRGMISQYNEQVPVFNATLERHNALYEDYSDLVDKINRDVNRYNTGRY